jgi:hypothetical protein
MDCKTGLSCDCIWEDVSQLNRGVNFQGLVCMKEDAGGTDVRRGSLAPVGLLWMTEIQRHFEWDALRTASLAVSRSEKLLP